MSVKEPVLIRDHFENNKQYNIPRAQLIIADIPYNIGNYAYGSNPSWYIGGDNKNGESELAGKQFFDTDDDFRLSNLLHFCSRLLVKEPKQGSTRKAGCMIVFCNWRQVDSLIKCAQEYGWNHSELFVFRKNYSAQVLKANMRPVGNFEVAVWLYKDRLPKFNNKDKFGVNHMEFTCMEWERDSKTPKVHPTQKPIGVLKHLIEMFTDEGDVVIDPVAGSGSTLLAAYELGREAYGFEIKKEFVESFYETVLPSAQLALF